MEFVSNTVIQFYQSYTQLSIKPFPHYILLSTWYKPISIDFILPSTSAYQPCSYLLRSAPASQPRLFLPAGGEICPSMMRIFYWYHSLTIDLSRFFRKFLSLLFSIWYFQNPFSLTHWVGTALVFGGIVLFSDIPSLLKSNQTKRKAD